MTAATLTRPRAKASYVDPALKDITPAAMKLAFESAAEALHAASTTDEAHTYSGDSDRLLRAAAVIAERAAGGFDSAGQAQNIAFDVAAQIKAARLVPGDAESAERTALIEAARVHLALLTGCEDCIQADRVTTPVGQIKQEAVERDLQDLAFSAASVSDLLEWVISAHDLIDSINMACSYDTVLAQRLQLHDIRRNQADWEASQMTDALGYLLAHQRDMITAMARGAAS